MLDNNMCAWHESKNMLWYALTCKEHLLVEASGSDRYMKVSNVRDLRWQVRHCTVDLNCPWNSATMMDSFRSLCLLQARSAPVWSSRWSFSSSLYRFLLSAWPEVKENDLKWYKPKLTARDTCLCDSIKNHWIMADVHYTTYRYHVAGRSENSLKTTWWIFKP